MWVPLTIVFFSFNPKHTAYFCCLQSGSSHINLCLCPDIQPLLFFQPLLLLALHCIKGMSSSISWPEVLL